MKEPEETKLSDIGKLAAIVILGVIIGIAIVYIFQKQVLTLFLR